MGWGRKMRICLRSSCSHHEREMWSAARVTSLGQWVFAGAASSGAISRGKRSCAVYRQSAGVGCGQPAAACSTGARVARAQIESTPDAEIQSRVDQYEMAFRMQTSIPEVTDLSQESAATLDSYGPM